MPAEFGDGGDAWAMVDCPGHGIVGTSVRVEKPTASLVFCGMKVFGHWWSLNVNRVYD